MSATTDYLKNEINELNKKAKNATLIGGILTGLILIYAVLGVWYVTVLFDPKNLAEFVIFRFKEQAPKVIAATEIKLIAAAPEVANNLSKNLQQAIPEFRYKAQGAISKIIDEKFDATEKSLVKITNSYFEAHADKFKPRAKKESIEAYGKRIANLVADDFGKNLNEQLISATHQDIYKINNVSEAVLAALDNHVDKLAKPSMDSLTRSEQLERMLVSHVINRYLSTVAK